MKLFMSGEIQADVTDEYSNASNEIEELLAPLLRPRDYGPGLKGWYDIVMITPWRDDKNYPEVKKYSKRNKEVEFRLRINHRAFKRADALGKRKLICKSLLRSIKLMSKMNIPDFDHARFSSDVTAFFEKHGWL